MFKKSLKEEIANLEVVEAATFNTVIMDNMRKFRTSQIGYVVRVFNSNGVLVAIQDGENNFYITSKMLPKELAHA